jgi:hypothetical protein
MTNHNERERLIYPDVIASTISGDEGRHFVTAQTNNQDTAVKLHIYWYIPGDREEPVLMIDVDDEDTPDSPDNMDITIRMRRNDGLVYEGNRADQENNEES